MSEPNNIPDGGMLVNLTVRDALALGALQAICGNPGIVGLAPVPKNMLALDCAEDRRQLAFRSYLLADAMLAAREKE